MPLSRLDPGKRSAVRGPALSVCLPIGSEIGRDEGLVAASRPSHAGALPPHLDIEIEAGERGTDRPY